MHHCISTKRINEKIAIIHLSQWLFKISDFLEHFLSIGEKEALFL